MKIVLWKLDFSLGLEFGLVTETAYQLVKWAAYLIVVFVSIENDQI